jgi:hypothetical protein
MCTPQLKEKEKAIPVRNPTNTLERSSFGYPVITAEQAGVAEYLKQNPHVAGMAWGGGENGSDPSTPRSIVINPMNQFMTSPEKRAGLERIEAIRHKMGETNYVPQFAITPEMQQYRIKTFKDTDPYLTDDRAFKQSLISRALAGDAPIKDPALEAESSQFYQKYFPQKTSQVINKP